ncbi:helix-turn-helix domain-containing protein [Arsenophonus nasoniae]|uniref:Helix-turn-helix transcriptional regulator n=1 Tax=Arsenophonus nasoniae TaxID=638 RepID=A0ABY8NWN8_9GAMM|nr:helix-turn-helix transcriptional regulator [Arsenophonus nasoniae]WGM08760.1 helix-turn-helix transcriptional regulator [Arsenophonus nasoniae]
MLHQKKIKENIINNTKYLLKSREENRLSFSEKTGITRSTVYKLLDGKITKSQETTIERIANFFGVSVKMLESVNIEDLERSEINLRSDGNKNPISVPVIPECEIQKSKDIFIGSLIISYPTTYCFSNENNVIGILLEYDKPPFYEKNEILFTRRYYLPKNNENIILLQNNKIKITDEFNNKDEFLGYVIEERKLHNAEL